MRAIHRLKAAAACVLFLSAAVHAETSYGADRADRAESIAVRAVLAAGAYEFPDAQRCGSEPGTALGDFLGDALLNLEGRPQDAYGFEVQCGSPARAAELAAFYSQPMFPDSAQHHVSALDASARLVQCSVGFHFSAEELAWSRSVQVLVNPAQEQAVPDTFRCLATP